MTSIPSAPKRVWRYRVTMELRDPLGGWFNAKNFGTFATEAEAQAYAALPELQARVSSTCRIVVGKRAKTR